MTNNLLSSKTVQNKRNTKAFQAKQANDFDTGRFALEEIFKEVLPAKASDPLAFLQVRTLTSTSALPLGAVVNCEINKHTHTHTQKCKNMTLAMKRTFVNARSI